MALCFLEPVLIRIFDFCSLLCFKYLDSPCQPLMFHLVHEKRIDQRRILRRIWTRHHEEAGTISQIIRPPVMHCVRRKMWVTMRLKDNVGARSLPKSVEKSQRITGGY